MFAEETLGKEAFGVLGIPTVFVIGRDGKIVGHAVGAGSESHDKFVKMVEDALATGPADATGKQGGH